MRAEGERASGDVGELFSLFFLSVSLFARRMGANVILPEYPGGGGGRV